MRPSVWLVFSQVGRCINKTVIKTIQYQHLRSKQRETGSSWWTQQIMWSAPLKPCEGSNYDMACWNKMPCALGFGIRRDCFSAQARLLTVQVPNCHRMWPEGKQHKPDLFTASTAWQVFKWNLLLSMFWGIRRQLRVHLQSPTPPRTSLEAWMAYACSFRLHGLGVGILYSFWLIDKLSTYSIYFFTYL